MSVFLPHIIISSKLYWRVNPLWRKAVFYYHRFRNQGKEGLKKRFYRGAIFVRFLWSVAAGILCLLLAITALEYVERILIDGWLGKQNYIQNAVLGYFGTSEIPAIDSDIYKDFASLLAALAGIYFATVSIVTSTSYSSLSRDTRSLIWAEKLNSFYFTFLVSLIVNLLILASTNAYGYNTGSLIFFATILCCIVAVWWFMRVSILLFEFFDSTVLLERQVIPDIGRLIKAATVEGFQWSVPAVQNHYQKRVENRLDVYENIVESSFKIREGGITVDKGQLKKLFGHTLSLLRYYGINKPGIPAESYWFKRGHKQADWFTSSSSATDIGLRTGGSLQPEQVPDNMWLEKALIGIAIKIIGVAHLSKDHLLIASLYSTLQQYIECLTKEHSADTANELFSSVKGMAQEFITNIEFTPKDYANVEQGLAPPLAVVDFFAMAPLAIIIGYRKGVEDFEKEKFAKTLASIKWDKDYGIYKHRLPHEVGSQLRYVQKGLRFERSVEGSRLSPDWYVAQLVSIGALRYLCAIPEKVNALIQKEYVDFANTLISQNRHLLAMQVIERGLEACSKCEAHFGYFKHIHEGLESTQQVQDIPKPKVDWNKAQEQLEGCRIELIRSFAKISPTTVNLPQHPSLPDYFGKAYWLISQECLYCIIQDKKDLFKLLFPMYFIHVFAAYNRFLQKYQETQADFWIVQNIDVIRDLLALSGYTLIYAELGQKELWEVVKSAWDAYLTALKEQNQDAEKWLHTIAKTSFVKSAYRSISNRDLAQSGWQTAVSRDLAKKGIIREERYSGFPGRNRPANHENAILEYVRRRASMGMWHGEPEDIFTALYILPKLPAALQEDMDEQVKDVAEEIAEITAENVSDTTQGGADGKA